MPHSCILFRRRARHGCLRVLALIILTATAGSTWGCSSRYSMTAVTIFVTAAATAPVVMNDEIIVIVLRFAYFQTFDLVAVAVVAEELQIY